MAKLALLAPLALLTGLFVLLAITGTRLFSPAMDMVPGLSDDHLQEIDQGDPVVKKARQELLGLKVRRIHALVGYWTIVTGWFLIPMIGVLPLVRTWGHVRRKILATSVTIVLLISLLLVMLLESFTGFLVGGMVEDPTGVSKGTFARFTVLHTFGLAFVVMLLLGLLWWIMLRWLRRLPKVSENAPEGRGA